MIQCALFTAFACLGALFGLATAGGRFSHLHGAIAFPIGVALFGALELLLLVVGVPLTLVTACAAWLVLCAVPVAIMVRRRSVTRAALRRAAGWTLGFGALSAVLASFNLTNASPDSFQLILTGQAIALEGGIPHALWERLGSRGVLTSLLHALGPLTGLEFLYALSPALACSFLATLAVGLTRAVGALGVRGRSVIVLVALTTATLATTYIFAWHAFYVHVNMPSGGYMLAMVVTFWVAEREQDASLLAASAACAVGLVLQRMEAPFVALMFAFLLVHGSRLPPRALATWLSSFSAVALAWSTVLVAHVGRTEYVSPGRTAMLGAGAAGLLVYLHPRGHDILPRWRARLPLLVLLLAALALVGLTAARFDHMWGSAAVTFSNVFDLEQRSWGYVPYLLVALAFVSLLVPRPPGAAVFVHGIPLYLLFVLLLVAARQPYRLGWGDSANRMLTHLLPFCFFYFGLRLIPALARDAGRAPSPGRAESPRARAAWRGVGGDLVATWLGAAALLAALEWTLLVAQAHQLFAGGGQIALMLPLELGNLLPYALASAAALALADLASQRLTGTLRRPRLAVAALAGALSVPYALWLARFTFSGPHAREMAHRSLLVAAACALIAGGFGLAFWLALLRRTWRRAAAAVAAGLAVAAGAALWLSRAGLPNEYLPLHQFLGVWSLLFATLAARELAPLVARSVAGGARVRLAAGAAAVGLVWAIAAGAMLARSQEHAWILWGETGATRYLTRRWTFLTPERSVPAGGPVMVVKPGLDTAETRARRQERARAAAPNIVLFSIDGLRRDHVGAFGYRKHPTTPTIDRFARRGVMFRNAFSSYPATQTFNSGLLLGRYLTTREDDQQPAGYRAEAITRLLHARGYHILVKGWFEHSSHQTFDPREYAIDTSIEKSRSKDELEEPMEERLARVATHLDEARASGQPVFIWMHLLGTHPVPGGRFVPDPAFPFGEERMDQYDSAIAGSDVWLDHLERLVAEKLPTDRPTYWFILADHGVHERTRSRDLRDGIVRVPLVAVGPGLAPRTEEGLVDVSLDLAATVLDLAGIDPPADYDGVSLVPILEHRAPADALAARIIPMTYLDLTGAVHAHDKVLTRGGSLSLFDLAADPDEQHNLVGENPGLADEMAAIAEAELRRRAESADRAGRHP